MSILNNGRRGTRHDQWLPLVPLLLAVLYVHRGWLTAPAATVAGALNHLGWLEGTEHWYWHIAHDIFQGINPFSNNWQAFPDGTYHLLLQGNFGDALLSAPLHWLFGFPLSYNLTVLLFTALNVFGLYRFARVFTEHRIVASLVACLVVVHPFFVALLEHGRLTQYLVGWAFLAMAEAAALMREPSRPIRWLVLCWVATFVSFWFYGIFLSLFLAAWVLVATRRRKWSDNKPFLRALGWTVACSIPFGLPLAMEALRGAGIQGVEFFSLPTPGARWSGSPQPLDFLALRPSELGAVVLPATIVIAATLALFGGWRRFSRPDWDLTALGLCAAGAAVLALGPFFTVYNDGAADILVPLPWYLLYAAVPFFSRLSYPSLVFPFLLAGMIGLSLRAATELSKLSALKVARHWLPTLVFALALAELVFRAPASLSSAPHTVPEPYQWLAEQEDADAILEYPFGYTDCAWVFQPVHGKCLMGTEGRFEDLRDWKPVDELFERSPALLQMAAVQRGEPLRPIMEEDFRQLNQEGFDYLVFRPISCGRQGLLAPEWVATTRDWFEESLGPPVREADGVSIFELPKGGTQRAVCGESAKR